MPCRAVPFSGHREGSPPPSGQHTLPREGSHSTPCPCAGLLGLPPRVHHGHIQGSTVTSPPAALVPRLLFQWVFNFLHSGQITLLAFLKISLFSNVHFSQPRCSDAGVRFTPPPALGPASCPAHCVHTQGRLQRVAFGIQNILNLENGKNIKR